VLRVQKSMEAWREEKETLKGGLRCLSPKGEALAAFTWGRKASSAINLVAHEAVLPHVKAARPSPLGDKHRRPPLKERLAEAWANCCSLHGEGPRYLHFEGDGVKCSKGAVSGSVANRCILHCYASLWRMHHYGGCSVCHASAYCPLAALDAVPSPTCRQRGPSALGSWEKPVPRVQRHIHTCSMPL